MSTLAIAGLAFSDNACHCVEFYKYPGTTPESHPLLLGGTGGTRVIKFVASRMLLKPATAKLFVAFKNMKSCTSSIITVDVDPQTDYPVRRCPAEDAGHGLARFAEF